MLCSFLKARDRGGRLTYTDLESPEFEEGAARNGYLDYETALASFHAVKADGELLSGMPVFQAAYAAVGLGWVWTVYDNPVAAKVLDWGYSIFARFRTGTVDLEAKCCSQHSTWPSQHHFTF